jgi:hypothetical protein
MIGDVRQPTIKKPAAAEFLPLLLYAAAGQSAACFT